MRELDFFLGRWQAVGIVHPMTPDAPRKSIEMRIEGSIEASGFWITRRARELPTAQNPVPLTGFAVWGYDAGTDEFVGYWYDSAGCRAEQRSRGWDGDRFELAGSVVNVLGDAYHLTDTFTRRGPDAYHHISVVLVGGESFAADEEECVRVAEL
jgi:hypothetical protein